jgi:dTDP-4-dehydrorhamnose reductase
MRVLVTGGTGYLGQFLLAALTRPPHSADTAVAYTYLSGTPPLGSDVQAFCADLASGRGVQEAVLSFAPHVVVNCAAVSQPGLCEQDHAAALAINCPQRLVDALAQLQQQAGRAALLVQLSTDQVYDGSRAWWSEGDPTQPVNAYGRSKLAAEQMLADIWQGRHVVLRSSLIYGSQAPLVPVQRPLFLQFIRQALEQQTPTAFFADEFRCVWCVRSSRRAHCSVCCRCWLRPNVMRPCHDTSHPRLLCASQVRHLRAGHRRYHHTHHRQV